MPDHPRIPPGTYRLMLRPVGVSHFDNVFHALMNGVCEYRGILWLPHVPGRTNIEIHTANFVEQLLGCLATGRDISRDENGDFMVAGGQSLPAYKALYPIVSSAILATETFLTIIDPT